MPRFRKKPVEIDAVLYTGPNFDEIEEFVGGDAEFRNGELTVATLEGPLHASPGDWIIKGVKGEFYPCKPDIFEATYEPVSNAPRYPKYEDWPKKSPFGEPIRRR